MGRRELIGFLAVVTMMNAIAIDAFLPGFTDMRVSFGLESDSPLLGRTITLYLLGSAFGMPVYGPLTDAIGRKRTLNLSLFLYIAAALLAALAPNLGTLYLSRVIWGFSAAGPRIVAQAVVRDRYSGDEMARVMALIQTVFFAGPILSPILGSGILFVASWRVLMAYMAFMAIVVIVWGSRMVETLTESNRTPFRPRAIMESARIVLANRLTINFALGMMFASGAFIAFLGSVELVMESVFGRPELFVPLFVASAVAQACGALTVSRIVTRVGARAVVLGAATGFSVFSLLLFAISWQAGWVPNMWLFMAVMLVINAFFVGFTPAATSLALVPMGERAGMAAAVIGSVRTAGSAVLAWIINDRIDGTVWSFATGFAVLGLLALIFSLAGLRHSAPEAAAA
jgi:DHA1 family bicyclomycin/chloramphenicol resistance-like MFS transporter